MPPIQLTGQAVIVVDVLAIILMQGAAGYTVNRMPLSMLRYDTWLLRSRPFERGGLLYTQLLRIKRWKDRVPEAGDFFKGGMSKKQLPSPEQGGISRFASETRRAELCHWLAVAPTPLFALWNPPWMVVLVMVSVFGVNLPFITIQRYNRIRAERVLRREGPSDLGEATWAPT